jgi:flagellar assembly factor FliW
MVIETMEAKEGGVVMEVETSRFGPLDIEKSDVIQFPQGILGIEKCRDWVLLADAQNDALGWLQSTDHPEVALAVVSPRRFVAEYQIRLPKRELSPLALTDVKDAQVLVILGKSEQGLSVNLKAPLVFNLEQRLGAQVVAKDDHPLQHPLTPPTTQLRKTA